MEHILAELELRRRDFHTFVGKTFPDFIDGWFFRVLCEKLAQFMLDVRAGKRPRLILSVPPRHGKALAVDTPIFTPNGWKTMGDLQVGDFVFHPSGRVQSVIAVSEVFQDRECWEVSTDDGHSVVADSDHLWSVSLCRKKRNVFTIHNTSRLASRNSRNPMIPEFRPLVLDEKSLPIPPYTLGVWLGDGNSHDGTICKNEEDLKHISERIINEGFKLGNRKDKDTIGILGFEKLITDNNLKQNKHIPNEYFFSSIEQRTSLLQGLIDTDGYVSPDGQVEFCTMDEKLSSDVIFLVHSLGRKASLIKGRAVLNNKDYGEKYRVLFYMENAASLPRKAKNCRNTSRCGGRYLNFKKTKNTDTKCIQVSSPDGLYLAGKGLIVTHNSEIVSVRFALWCLLNNPDWEVVVSSYGQDLAERFSRRARSLLSHPHVNSLWNINPDHKHSAVREWKLNQGRPCGTYKAVGRGSSLTGAGAHILVIDDPLKDTKEADSLTVRDNLWDWYCGVARTRLAPGGGIVVVETRWHQDDLVGRLLQEQESTAGADHWDVLQFQAIADSDEQYRQAGEALHPERFTLAELEAARSSMAPRLWLALFQQQPTTPGGTMVKEEWFKHYNPGDLDLNSCDDVIQVWDLRFGKSQSKTSSFVVGQCWARKGSNCYLIDQLRDRWSFAESKAMLQLMTERYPQAITKLVENKANGPALESDLQDEIPGIILHDPRGDKLQRLERVLPLFMAGNVYLPQTSWIKEYQRELISFPNSANDDQVDCTSMALGWFHDKIRDVDEVFLLNI